MSDVTILGLGAMGQSLATALLAGGHSVTVWNRTHSKTSGLAAKGATTAASVEAAVAASPVTIVCLLDYDAVRETVEQAHDELAGKVLVNLTNGLPEDAEAIASWAGEAGITYIDGGIMAVPPMIGQPGAFMFYSGVSEKVLADLAPLLSGLGKVVYAGDEPGAASLLDLALNGAMYGMVGGAVTAMLTVRSVIDAGQFTNEHLIPYLTGITSFLPHLARQIETGTYAENVSSTLAMQAVGFRNIVKASRNEGVSPELLIPIQEILDRGVDAGCGKEEFSSVAKLLCPSLL